MYNVPDDEELQYRNFALFTSVPCPNKMPSALVRGGCTSTRNDLIIHTPVLDGAVGGLAGRIECGTVDEAVDGTVV